MQTTLPPYANNLREGWSKVVAQEGFGGLYKGLYPLWARQIPYTMVKFATFESAVAQIYATLGKPKEAYNTLQQTGVSFLGGYIAGIGCAVVSHPADVMVSKLNADRKAGEGAGQAIGRIYKNIGFSGLWNGLPVRIAMIGTLTAFQWLIYDSFKVYLGVSKSSLPWDRIEALPWARSYSQITDNVSPNSSPPPAATECIETRIGNPPPLEFTRLSSKKTKDSLNPSHPTRQPLENRDRRDLCEKVARTSTSAATTTTNLFECGGKRTKRIAEKPPGSEEGRRRGKECIIP